MRLRVVAATISVVISALAVSTVVAAPEDSDDSTAFGNNLVKIKPQGPLVVLKYEDFHGYVVNGSICLSSTRGNSKKELNLLLFNRLRAKNNSNPRSFFDISVAVFGCPVKSLKQLGRDKPVYLRVFESREPSPQSPNYCILQRWYSDPRWYDFYYASSVTKCTNIEFPMSVPMDPIVPTAYAVKGSALGNNTKVAHMVLLYDDVLVPESQTADFKIIKFDVSHFERRLVIHQGVPVQVIFKDNKKVLSATRDVSVFVSSFVMQSAGGVVCNSDTEIKITGALTSSNTKNRNQNTKSGPIYMIPKTSGANNTGVAFFGSPLGIGNHSTADNRCMISNEEPLWALDKIVTICRKNLKTAVQQWELVSRTANHGPCTMYSSNSSSSNGTGKPIFMCPAQGCERLIRLDDQREFQVDGLGLSVAGEKLVVRVYNKTLARYSSFQVQNGSIVLIGADTVLAVHNGRLYGNISTLFANRTTTFDSQPAICGTFSLLKDDGSPTDAWHAPCAITVSEQQDFIVSGILPATRALGPVFESNDDARLLFFMKPAAVAAAAIEIGFDAALGVRHQYVDDEIVFCNTKPTGKAVCNGTLIIAVQSDLPKTQKSANGYDLSVYIPDRAPIREMKTCLANDSGNKVIQVTKGLYLGVDKHSAKACVMRNLANGTIVWNALPLSARALKPKTNETNQETNTVAKNDGANETEVTLKTDLVQVHSDLADEYLIHYNGKSYYDPSTHTVQYYDDWMSLDSSSQTIELFRARVNHVFTDFRCLMRSLADSAAPYYSILISGSEVARCYIGKHVVLYSSIVSLVDPTHEICNGTFAAINKSIATVSLDHYMDPACTFITISNNDIAINAQAQCDIEKVASEYTRTREIVDKSTSSDFTLCDNTTHVTIVTHLGTMQRFMCKKECMSHDNKTNAQSKLEPQSAALESKANVLIDTTECMKMIRGTPSISLLYRDGILDIAAPNEFSATVTKHNVTCRILKAEDLGDPGAIKMNAVIRGTHGTIMFLPDGKEDSQPRPCVKSENGLSTCVELANSVVLHLNDLSDSVAALEITSATPRAIIALAIAVPSVLIFGLLVAEFISHKRRKRNNIRIAY